MNNATDSRSFLVALDLQQRLLDHQMRSLDSIDNKTGVIFGFASGVLTIPGALLAREATDVARTVLILLVWALVAYVAVAVLSLLSMRVRDWDIGVRGRRLRQQATALDQYRFARWLTGAYGLAYDRNCGKWTEKGWLSLGAMLAFGVEALLVSIAMIVAIAN